MREVYLIRSIRSKSERKLSAKMVSSKCPITISNTTGKADSYRQNEISVVALFGHPLHYFSSRLNVMAGLKGRKLIGTETNHLSILGHFTGGN